MAKKISNTEILAVRAAEADPARGRVWVGLDVGLKSTAVCVLDGDGKVVHQCSMKTHPTEIGRYLAKNFTSNVAVVGMETGAMSVHLSGGLRRLGYQVAVMDALQVCQSASKKDPLSACKRDPLRRAA